MTRLLLAGSLIGATLSLTLVSWAAGGRWHDVSKGRSMIVTIGPARGSA